MLVIQIITGETWTAVVLPNNEQTLPAPFFLAKS